MKNYKIGDRVLITVDNFLKGQTGKIVFLNKYSADIELDDKNFLVYKETNVVMLLFKNFEIIQEALNEQKTKPL